MTRRQNEDPLIVQALKSAGITEEQLKDPEFLKLINKRIDEWYDHAKNMKLEGNYFEVMREVEPMQIIFNHLIQVKVVCETYQTIAGGRI